MTLYKWVKALRPQTLTASVAPIAMGASLAHFDTQMINTTVLMLTLFSALMIQCGTNLINDYYDFIKKVDTADRIGPPRVFHTSSTTPQTVMRVALCFFILATLFAIPLVFYGGLIIVVVGALSLLAGYFYTAGRFSFSQTGLADIMVFVFFGWVAVMGTYYLQTGTHSWEAFIVGTQSGALCTLILIVNNMRDMAQDKLSGRKTLTVRFGLIFSQIEFFILFNLAFVLLYYLFFQHQEVWLFLPLLIFPLYMLLFFKIFQTKPSPQYNSFLKQASLLYLLFGALQSASFVLV